MLQLGLMSFLYWYLSSYYNGIYNYAIIKARVLEQEMIHWPLTYWHNTAKSAIVSASPSQHSSIRLLLQERKSVKQLCFNRLKLQQIFYLRSWPVIALFYLTLSNVSPLFYLPQDTINNVKSRLGKSMQIQTLLRAFEARDRNIQESNFDRVNFWSIVNLAVMMLVSAVQVYLVRSLFEDKRKSRT